MSAPVLPCGHTYDPRLVGRSFHPLCQPAHAVAHQICDNGCVFDMREKNKLELCPLPSADEVIEAK